MANNIPLNQRERKQRAIKIVLITGLIITVFLVLLLTGLLRKGYQAVFLTPTPTQDPRAAIAEAGVMAYFNFEYNGDYDAWLKNICAISTDITCMGMEATYGPALQEAATNSQKSSTTTNVHAIKMVDENQSEITGHQQIWAVQYTYSNWNGEKATYDYVMITENDGVWKFDNFVMLPQEYLDEAFGAMLTPQATSQP
jgi:hypothetical protein